MVVRYGSGSNLPLTYVAKNCAVINADVGLAADNLVGNKGKEKNKMKKIISSKMLACLELVYVLYSSIFKTTHFLTVCFNTFLFHFISFYNLLFYIVFFKV